MFLFSDHTPVVGYGPVSNNQTSSVDCRDKVFPVSTPCGITEKD